MNFNNMKEFMNRLTDWVIPGNSIVIYKDCKKVLEYSSGYSDLENRTMMNGSELLNIYSCSKPATVTAGLQLYEKGYFLLDDPLYEYMPEFREMYVKDSEGIKKADNDIKIRDLFCMTAGFSYDTGSMSFKKARELTEGHMNTRKVIECLAEEPLLFEPGTEWRYSLCHDVLAALIEVVSGMRFSEYMKENIFKPLDMTSTCYHTDEKIAPQYRCINNDFDDIVEMQKSAKGGGEVERDDKNGFVFGDMYDSGGAGIVTTVDDYGKFAAALANKGRGINGNSVLSPGTVELLKTNQLNDDLLKYFDWNQHKGYGYGLGVRTLMDKAVGGSNGSIGEFGWGGAAGATIIMDTKENLAMFYSHHMKNPQEEYYQPRLRNVLYSCIK